MLWDTYLHPEPVYKHLWDHLSVRLGTPQPTINAAFGPQGNLPLPCSQLVQGGDA